MFKLQCCSLNSIAVFHTYLAIDICTARSLVFGHQPTSCAPELDVPEWSGGDPYPSGYPSPVGRHLFVVELDFSWLEFPHGVQWSSPDDRADVCALLDQLPCGKVRMSQKSPFSRRSLALPWGLPFNLLTCYLWQPSSFAIDRRSLDWKRFRISNLEFAVGPPQLDSDPGRFYYLFVKDDLEAASSLDRRLNSQ